jgi:hypothetical protein
VDRDRMRPDTDTNSAWFIAEGRPKKKKKPKTKTIFMDINTNA